MILKNKSSKKEEKIDINGWDKYFNLEEIMEFKSMKNIECKHIKHPIWYLINGEQNISYNTQLSFNNVFNNDAKYLSNMITKIVNKRDFSNINGILGEIRCYGYLLDSFSYNKNIKIQPIQTKKNKETADFEIYNNVNNEKIYVEVNTKQCNREESIKLAEFQEKTNSEFKKPLKKENICNNRPIIHTRVTSFAPFGRSKDHVNVDAIQKIAQVKSDKHQIPEDSIGILWIDLQSEGINRTVGIEDAEPLHYHYNYGMFSGILWYALYGKKELPIFNNNQFYFAYEGYSKFDRMRHDGIFVKRNDISAVVISESRYTLMFENPFCEKKIPMWFLENIINLPRFNYEHSKIQFPKYDIKQEIKNEYKKINNLSKIPNIRT